MYCIENTKSLVGNLISWPKAVASIRRRSAFEKQCISHFQALGNELERLSHSSESDFLAIGEGLQDFYLRAGEISQMSASIVELLSGPEITGAIQTFSGIFDRVKQFEDRSGQSAEVLAGVLENISRMQAYVEGFRQTVMLLRVLCVSTKIETARVGGKSNDFGILADEVAKMANDIEARHDQLMDRSQSLRKLIEHTLIRVDSLDTVRHQQAGIIFDRILKSLRSLEGKQQQSSTTASSIAARYASVSSSIGEIVASMQFHDITRQRMEHTAKSLLSLSCSLHSRQSTKEDAGEKQDAGGRRWGLSTGSFQGSERLKMTGDICEL